jgi:hypothetical protein
MDSATRGLSFCVVQYVYFVGKQSIQSRRQAGWWFGWSGDGLLVAVVIL